MGRVLMEKFKEIYERWMDIWNGDLDLIGEVVSPAFVGHWPPVAVDAPFDVIGPARLREMVGMSRNLFPDLRVEVQVGPVTEGDTMAARWVGRGHYAGGIRGATAPAGDRGALLRERFPAHRVGPDRGVLGQLGRAFPHGSGGRPPRLGSGIKSEIIASSPPDPLPIRRVGIFDRPLRGCPPVLGVIS